MSIISKRISCKVCKKEIEEVAGFPGIVFYGGNPHFIHLHRECISDAEAIYFPENYEGKFIRGKNQPKFYKSRPKHLYWKDVESGDLLRIEPVNRYFSVLHTIVGGYKRREWINGFILHPEYVKITQAEYEENLKK